MKKGLTELVFILDRSGSMAGLESDTIGGFNGMLKKQRQVEGEAIVTTVLFDDRYELLHDRIRLDGVPAFTGEEYYVRGCTALLDAVGQTIRKVIGVQKNTAEAHRAEKVIFVITTDGLENASREYSYEQVRNLIKEEQEKYGWEFLFLGANMDAVSEGDRLGIRAERSVTFECSSAGLADNYRAVSCFLEKARCQKTPMGAEWKKPIEEGRRRREKQGRHETNTQGNKLAKRRAY